MHDVPLTPDLVLAGYKMGIFPMAESREDQRIFWVDPPLRGIVPLDGFRLSRSLRRRILGGGFTVTADHDFPGVMEGCADRPETWINDAIFGLYGHLHALGHAHSIEVWAEGRLAGGVYGVSLQGVFFGESMFSRRRDASKVALAYLIDRLRQGGYSLFDTQFLTPHLASLGGVEIGRQEFHMRLRQALTRAARFDTGALPPPQEMVQRMTQIS